ncbi:hypothetical protein E6R60_26625 [Streptomyces sp. A0642]|uniref:hypothetical protein n=1 Tax=Streptomyces sp. A0642 TaxID=2563100 RepID=UPI0010A20197|nr:hypothetical protein [Streptomyces sp. A0642]THA72508.1 hypothetical protein E6R60_26625 [Streptomyces sp. A0642]
MPEITRKPTPRQVEALRTALTNAQGVIEPSADKRTHEGLVGRDLAAWETAERLFGRTGRSLSTYCVITKEGREFLAALDAPAAPVVEEKPVEPAPVPVEVPALSKAQRALLRSVANTHELAPGKGWGLPRHITTAQGAALVRRGLAVAASSVSWVLTETGIAVAEEVAGIPARRAAAAAFRGGMDAVVAAVGVPARVEALRAAEGLLLALDESGAEDDVPRGVRAVLEQLGRARGEWLAELAEHAVAAWSAEHPQESASASVSAEEAPAAPVAPVVAAEGVEGPYDAVGEWAVTDAPHVVYVGGVRRGVLSVEQMRRQVSLWRAGGVVLGAETARGVVVRREEGGVWGWAAADTRFVPEVAGDGWEGGSVLEAKPLNVDAGFAVGVRARLAEIMSVGPAGADEEALIALVDDVADALHVGRVDFEEHDALLEEIRAERMRIV